MSTERISSSLMSTLVGRFSSISSSSKSAASALVSGNSSQTSLSSTLRIGARTYGTAVQGLNSLLSFTNLSQTTLGNLLDITDKMLSLTERSAHSGTSSNGRMSLDLEFKKLAAEFEKVVSSSELGDNNYLTKDGLSALFKKLGLDETTSDSVSQVFEDFILTNQDDALASEYNRGARPIQLPLTQRTSTTVTTDGSGSFSTSVSYASGTNSPSYVQVADVSGDSTSDIIVGSANSNIEVLVSNGNGTFRSPIAVSSTGQTSLNIGDFDEDGNNDLVFAESASGLFLSLGNGNSTFQAPVASGSSGVSAGLTDILVGYFDSDSHLDVIGKSAAGGDSSFHVYLGNGDGTFNAGVSYDIGISSGAEISLADVNGDSTLDVLFGTNSSAVAGVSLGNVDGTFNAPIVTVLASGTRIVAAGDLDGDTVADLVTADDATLKLQVWHGNGDGTFDSPTQFDIQDVAREIKVEDINGDTFLDVVLLEQFNLTPARTEILLGNNDGTFKWGTGTTLGTNASPEGLALGDVNQDGVADIVVPDNLLANSNVHVSLSGTTSTSNTTTSTYVERASEFETLFDSDRGIKTRGNAFKMRVDLKKLQHQIERNIDNLESAKQLISDNIELVRQTGLALLELSDQLTGKESADQVTAKLSSLVRARAGGVLSQAENLDAITVATLTLGN